MNNIIDEKTLNSLGSKVRDVAVLLIVGTVFFKAGAEFFSKATTFAKEGLPAIEDTINKGVGLLKHGDMPCEAPTPCGTIVEGAPAS